MSISIQDLSKTYESQVVVDNISLGIEKGEIVGFLGPNGAGKSTTMRMMTGYVMPDKGEIFIQNLNIKTHLHEIKKNIGYLPENNPLYVEMPVIDYLYFCGQIQGLSKNLVITRIKEMIEVCGLHTEKHKKIGELSKGYKQRVGLAQAMIHNPKLLILDEPTSGLDPNQIIEIRKLIKEIGKDKTIILSSHILSEVEATCDRILIINKGKIVADGTADELAKKGAGTEILKIKIEADTQEVEKQLLNLTQVEQVKTKEGNTTVYTKPNTSSRKAIFDLCVKNKWYLLEMRGVKTNLEQIFRELTHK